MPEGQKAGPKGRQLEVGAQWAPRLLVINMYFLGVKSTAHPPIQCPSEPTGCFIKLDQLLLFILCQLGGVILETKMTALCFFSLCEDF